MEEFCHFLFNLTNNVIIILSTDTKTLTFDPVTQLHEDRNSCYDPVSNMENIRSNLVPLTILCNLIVYFYVVGFTYFIT